MSSLPLPTLNDVFISGEYGSSSESNFLKPICGSSSNFLDSVPKETKHKPLKLVAAGGGVVLFCTVDDELYYHRHSSSHSESLMLLSLEQPPMMDTSNMNHSRECSPKIKFICCGSVIVSF